MAFPYLLLLVSGGHCQLLVVEGVGRYRRLGTTIDDAAGEAFDKGAKLLGLGFPGGPAIERAAARGDASALRAAAADARARRAAISRSPASRPRCAQRVEARRRDVDATATDLAASLQAAIGDCLVDRARERASRCSARVPDGRHAGGRRRRRRQSVLRARLAALAAARRVSLSSRRRPRSAPTMAR